MSGSLGEEEKPGEPNKSAFAETFVKVWENSNYIIVRILPNFHKYFHDHITVRENLNVLFLLYINNSNHSE